MFNSKIQRNISYIVLGIYIMLLIWLILFKFTTNFSELDHIRNINFIPFSESLIINGHMDIKEIVYNILVFVPLGVYVGTFKPNWSFLRKAMPSLCLSLLFETLQFIFAIGASDITDLIGNTLGGVIGIVIFLFFNRIFKKKSITIINCIGLIVEFLAIAMLGFLFIGNM